MANEKNLKPIRSVSQAREMQKKSAQARSKNAAERKLIKDRILERMGESDWDIMIDGLISRAMDSDKAFEILRDTIGEKPIDKTVQANIDTEYLESVEYISKLFSED